MAEDVGGDDDGLRLVRLPEHFLEALLEVVAVGIEAAVEESVAFEGLFLADPLLLLQLHVLHQLRVVERGLPEEINLLVLELLGLAFEVISDLVVSHLILEVLFAVIVAHDLVELLELLPPPGQHCLHDSIDWLFHCVGVDVLEGFGREKVLACEVFNECAGHKAADAVGRAILIGQVLHLLRVLVEHLHLAYLHFDYRQQEADLSPALLVSDQAIMNIQVTNNCKVIQSKHYQEFLTANEEERFPDCEDVAKLLAVKRHLTAKPAELELMSLCKSNQAMRRVVLQAKQICLSGQETVAVINRLAELLQKY